MAITFDEKKKKKERENSNLVAVNLHDRRPSSITTSKISHVTKNRDWFLAYDQSDQLTNVKPVARFFFEVIQLIMVILIVLVTLIMTMIAIMKKLLVMIMSKIIIMILKAMLLHGIVIIVPLLPFL